MTIRSSEATRIDKHVANRLRAARKLAGLSQAAAGDKLGLTFQQVQKYENGSNRISAGKLCQLAKLYNVAPSWFFEGLEAATEHPDIMQSTGGDVAAEFLSLPYGADLAKDFIAIASNQNRLIVANVAHALRGQA